MTITFTDSVETATFDTADGSIKINLKWWGSLATDEKALIIIHELQALRAWRDREFSNTPTDSVINADIEQGFVVRTLEVSQ
jgi:hypothetical protein|tara:strand:- start:660 stop:905 length:246 start_codon:yes stop_codon:yes gene_type:complete